MIRPTMQPVVAAPRFSRQPTADELKTLQATVQTTLGAQTASEFNPDLVQVFDIKKSTSFIDKAKAAIEHAKAGLSLANAFRKILSNKAVNKATAFFWFKCDTPEMANKVVQNVANQKKFNPHSQVDTFQPAPNEVVLKIVAQKPQKQP